MCIRNEFGRPRKIFKAKVCSCTVEIRNGELGTVSSSGHSLDWDTFFFFFFFLLLLLVVVLVVAEAMVVVVIVVILSAVVVAVVVTA